MMTNSNSTTIFSADDNGRFPSVNCCIYCGTVQGTLTKEHIVPYSLGGREILPNATCGACQNVTSAFERICARTMFNSLRIREELPTRRPKDRPTSAETETDRGDLVLDVQDVLATRPLVAFPQAGYLREPSIKSRSFEGTQLAVQTDAPKKTDSWKRNHVVEMTTDQWFHVESLARLYAKIAHGFSVGWFGKDSFTHWLPPYILGTDDCLPYIVGGMPGGERPFPRSYQLSWRVYDVLNNLLVVNLRLFANLGGPWSHVVVGEMTDEAVSMLKSNRHS